MTINSNNSKRVLTDIVLLAEKIAKEEGGQSFVYPEEQMFDLIEELCRSYLHEEADERKSIRDFIHEIKGGIRLPGLIYIVPNAIYAFIQSTAKRIRSKADGKLLEVGLAAASIEEGNMDSRDLFMSLKELHEAAEKVGIDSTAQFKVIIGISGNDGAKVLNSFLLSAKK